MMEMFTKEEVMRDAQSPAYYENTRWAYLGRLGNRRARS